MTVLFFFLTVVPHLMKQNDIIKYPGMNLKMGHI